MSIAPNACCCRVEAMTPDEMLALMFMSIIRTSFAKCANIALPDTSRLHSKFALEAVVVGVFLYGHNEDQEMAGAELEAATLLYTTAT